MPYTRRSPTRLQRAFQAAMRFLSWRGPIAILIFALGFVAFEAGVGMTDRPGLPGADFVTHIYYTLGLFVLGGMDLGVPSSGPAWAQLLMWTCYFAAPAVTASAVVEGLLRAIRSESWITLPPRRHIVIAGAGKLAELYLDRLREVHRSKKVIVVELNPDQAIEDLFREQYGAEVRAGDITNPLLLESLNLRAADRILLLTGDDFTNLDAATRILNMEGDAVASRVVIHVSDIRMVRVLKKTRSRLLTSCGLFNSHHIAATHLVQTRLLEHFKRTHPRDIVVLAGFGRFGQTMLDELQLHAQGCFDTMILLDTDARMRVADFQEQVGFISGYRHHVVDGDLQDPAIWWELQSRFKFDETEPVFILGSGDDATNLRTAMWLAQRFPSAYVVARMFRESDFAQVVAQESGFSVVSVAALVQRSMPRAWFRFRRRLLDELP